LTFMRTIRPFKTRRCRASVTTVRNLPMGLIRSTSKSNTSHSPIIPISSHKELTLCQLSIYQLKHIIISSSLADAPPTFVRYSSRMRSCANIPFRVEYHRQRTGVLSEIYSLFPNCVSGASLRNACFLVGQRSKSPTQPD
jgi:hypothetical protein